MNRFEAQRSGDYEYEGFDGAELEGANFGEAEFGVGEFVGEFGEAEYPGGELEGEWEGERDHRRRFAPQAAVGVRDHRGGMAARATRPTAWSSQSRSYAPRSAWWGTRTNYGSRPVSRSWSSSGSRPWSRPWSRSWSGSAYRPYGQRYRWGQPGVSSQWYRSGQYPGQYWPGY